MNLLNELEKKTIGHPAKNLDFCDKGNYLKALAFFIHIDEVISEEEKYIFNEIIESLECEDIKEDLFDFLNNPSVEEYDEVFSLFSNNMIKDSYIMDCVILSCDVNSHENDEFTFNKEEEIFLKYVFENTAINFDLNFISQEENKYLISMIRRKKSFSEKLLRKRQQELEIEKRKALEEEKKYSIEKERREGIIGFIMIVIMVAGYYFFSWKGVGVSFILMVIIYAFFEKYIENYNKDNENE